MNRATVGLALILSLASIGLSLPRKATDENAQAGLDFNSEAYSPVSGETLLRPGRPNRLRVRSRPQDGGGPGRVCEVRRIVVGREEFREVKRLDVRTGIVEFELGPMAAPPVYEFEAGVVYQRGYALAVALKDESGRPVSTWEFDQGLAREASHRRQGMGEADPPVRPVRLLAGVQERVVFDPKFGSLPPVSLRLGESALIDPNRLEIQARLNQGDSPAALDGWLRATGSSGRELWAKKSCSRRGRTGRLTRWMPGRGRPETIR